MASTLSVVEQMLGQSLGNIEYNGERPLKIDGKFVKGKVEQTVNVHLVLFDSSIRGGMTDKKKNKDGTPVKYSHCVTIPINVGEILAKLATQAIVAGEGEAFAVTMTRLCSENREWRKTLATAPQGSATQAPVFLGPKA